uniref:ATP synthase CF0 B' subunit n=1 Tax=Glaucocystis incrassata TaxID=1789788 RepID=A0A3G1IVJ6_9EUKA|nr:ATP synthase CF0 B' subunit [Glaucocystis incrassata]ASQ40077.1 ATP synthase CF0 B' subunit [Glaucocystis incrassata]
MVNEIIWLVFQAEASAPEGGLFDFDGTLPVMIVQLFVFMILLKAVFYQPLTKILQERQEYIQANLKEAQDCLQQIQELNQQYDKKIMEARKYSSNLIDTSKVEMQNLRNQKLAEAQLKSENQFKSATAQLEKQREECLKILDTEIQTFSNKIIEKLLGIQISK